MAVDSTHPLYDERIDDWRQLRDTYEGERKVKEENFRYLPPTSGMIEDGVEQGSDRGRKAYDAYRTRAVVPDAVGEAVQALLGAMHRKPAVIELPSALEPLRDRATLRGESLQVLLERINEEQLILGRVGILADIIDVGDRTGEFYIAMYRGEHIINWDEAQREPGEIQNLNFVSLDESTNVRNEDFEWEFERRFRVLILGDPDTNQPAGIGTYQVAVFTEDETQFRPDRLEIPEVGGNRAEDIPFVFINGQDIAPEPAKPPMLGLSNLVLTIYRGEADYRQSLFMQGQDTLVKIGVAQDDGATRVGAGASITIPNPEGDAKYIGVDSSGLPEQRQSLENDYRRAQEKAGTLIDTASRERESGEALRIRVASRTTTLRQVSLAGAFGLQDLLRKVAVWVGADPEKVIVTPNLEFAEITKDGEDLTKFVTAKTMGAQISHETIHRNMQEGGVMDRSFEEELEQIQREQEELGITPPPASSNEDGPEDDELEDDEVEEEEEETANA